MRCNLCPHDMMLYLMLNSEFMNNDMEQVDQCGWFFAYIAAWDTSHISDGVGHFWICQTSIELVGDDCC